MKRGRGLVFRGAGQPLEVEEFPVPEPRGAEVLVAVSACTLCGSDLHTLRGRRLEPVPTILGHEILGRVAALGPEAPSRDAAGRPLRIGDRVTWGLVASCGQCFFCDRSLPQKCVRRLKYGHEPLRHGCELTGGLADFCLLQPGTAIFRVPEPIDDETACPANCATATVAAALELAGPLAEQTVLVMGTGMLGVTAVAWARSLGAAVVACDQDADRRFLAQGFGAVLAEPPESLSSAVEQLTGVRGVDVALELTGAPEAFEGLFSQVRVGGIVVLVGSTYPSRPAAIELEQIVRRCLTLRGIHNYAPAHLQAALAFLAEHPELPWASLVAGWRSLDEVEAMVAQGLPPGRLRLGVRPGG